MTRFDVGIVGLGAMGSMAALELARRGRRVIGFDRLHPPHVFGSSHGKSRIIREAYFEHPQYVPIVQRAYEQWTALERECGRTLLVPTGGLMIGAPDGGRLAGARRSAAEHRLPSEELSASEVRSRFPVFEPASNRPISFEPRAGVLFPEEAVGAALDQAARAGAELRFDQPVTAWNAGEAITVRTGLDRFTVDRLGLAAGAWMSGALPRTSLPLAVARQTLFRFAAAGEGALGAKERVPEEFFCGFPDLGEGGKVPIPHQGEPADPDHVPRTVLPGEADRLRGVMETRIPACAGPLRKSCVCLYTNTPDRDFILDRHPDEPRVVLASPCSGHGFKFAPAIGEAIADLVEDREPRFDLAPFRIARFA